MCAPLPITRIDPASNQKAGGTAGHPLAATLTDRFGHSAAAITSRVNIDTTPPLFTSLAPADNSLFWFADANIEGAVNEAGSLVTLTPGYQSGMSPFRFPVTLGDKGPGSQ
jgi:hypothetical protein